MIDRPSVDWMNPDYNVVFEHRRQVLKDLVEREDHDLVLAALRVHYRHSPWDFMGDWGVSFDPRNIERGITPIIPMILWPRQEEYLRWVYERWQTGERGLVEKCRDGGVTWLSVGFAVCMWLFVDGFTVSFGSRKEELVDKRGDHKSIFEKLRFFIEYLPKILLPRKWNDREHSMYMRILNPENGATITGEAGDEIGRGGRTSVYFVDEAAFIERQLKVDSALSQNTNCQIDISTPNGPGNHFYKKRQRFTGTQRLFIFDWTDDPRHDQAWLDKQIEENDEQIVAQEILRDYNAAAKGAFIPAKWVESAVDAHVTLGFDAQGLRVTGFDPADVGDARAIVNRHGSIIMDADTLAEGDITHAIPWAFEVADTFRADVMSYDGDGMGSPAMKVALLGRSAGRMEIHAYHGSAGVWNPGGLDEEGLGRSKPLARRTALMHEVGVKTNLDRYLNYRAQTWSWLRERFRRTHDAVALARENKLVNVDPETLISLSSKCTKLVDLKAELSSPRREPTPNGKIKVESKDHMKAREVSSPNLADALVIAMSYSRREKKVVARKIVDHDYSPGDWMSA